MPEFQQVELLRYFTFFNSNYLALIKFMFTNKFQSDSKVVLYSPNLMVNSFEIIVSLFAINITVCRGVAACNLADCTHTAVENAISICMQFETYFYVCSIPLSFKESLSISTEIRAYGKLLKIYTNCG